MDDHSQDGLTKIQKLFDMTYLSFQRLKHRVLDILKNAFIIKDEPQKMKNDNFEHLELWGF